MFYFGKLTCEVYGGEKSEKVVGVGCLFQVYQANDMIQVAVKE
jgi:hypothetical protein